MNKLNPKYALFRSIAYWSFLVMCGMAVVHATNGAPQWTQVLIFILAMVMIGAAAALTQIPKFQWEPVKSAAEIEAEIEEEIALKDQKR